MEELELLQVKSMVCFDSTNRVRGAEMDCEEHCNCIENEFQG